MLDPQFQILMQDLTSTQMLDVSDRVTAATWRYTEQGCGDLSVTMPCTMQEAYWFKTLPFIYIKVFNRCSKRIWWGRAAGDDVAITRTADGAVSIQLLALGLVKALEDIPHTGWWSSTRYGDWQDVPSDLIPSRTPERFSFETERRLRIAPSGGNGFTTSSIGMLSIAQPTAASVQWQTIEASYTLKAPTGWRASLSRYDGTTFLSSLWTLDGIGTGATGITTQSGTLSFLSGVSCSRLGFNLFCTRAATNLHTAAITAGTRTVTPGTMAGIAVNAKLAIGGAEPEEVVVTATTATTFTAVFRNAHLGSDLVEPLWDGNDGDIELVITNVRVKAVTTPTVTLDQLAKSALSEVLAVNPWAVFNSDGKVQSPLVDIANLMAEDQPWATILSEQVQLGDTSNRPWVWGVDEDGVLFVRPRQSGRVWYVSTEQCSYTQGGNSDGRWTSGYGVYEDEQGQRQRTPIQTDAQSLANSGLVRRTALPVDSGTLAVATQRTSVFLSDAAKGEAAASLTCAVLETVDGMVYPATEARPGDMLLFRDVLPTSSAVANRLNGFVLAEVQVDGFNLAAVQLVPEEPLPLLEMVVAKAAIRD